MKEYIKLNNQVMQKENGFFQLEKDKEAVQLFQQEVESKLLLKDKTILDRLYWLIKNNYYINFFTMYDKLFLVTAHNVAYGLNFQFQSYMAISKFYQSYALKTDDKKYYLETYEERVVATALHLANGNEQQVLNYIVAMITQQYQPATPTFQNAGKARGGEFISCFLLSMDDSLNSINYNLSTMGQLSKIGGGVATDLSNLRGRGDAIKGVKGAASGVVPVMKLMEDTFSYVNQLGQRNGAGVANLNIFHWDIEEFLSTKKISGDEKSRLQTLSIGVLVPDKFVELARNNEDMYVFSPYDIYKVFGLRFDEVDWDKDYDMMLNSEVRKRKLNPRKLLTNIAKTQFESGYPYITYISNANKNHALKHLGRVKQSNLCVTGETRLHTNKGMIKVEDLYRTQEQIKVSVDGRTKKLDHKCKTVELVDAIPVHLTAKQADIYKVKTQQGYEIRATEWHKFYRQLEDKTIEKVALNELKIGDKLLVQSNEGFYGQFNDVELAYLAGVVNGDGTVADKSIRIILHKDKKELKDKIETYVANVIKRYLNKEKVYQHNTILKPVFHQQKAQDFVGLNSAVLFDIFEDFGITKETKTRVPEFVFRGTKEVVGAYLLGLYQMDGAVNASIKYKAMSYELSSIDLDGIKDLQILLANCGVYATLYEFLYKPGKCLMSDGKGGKKLYKAKGSHRLTIQDRTSRDRFNEIVTMKNKDEQKILEFNKTLQPKSRAPKHEYTTTITSIKFDGVEDVYDTTQPDYNSLIFNGIATGNCQEIMQLQEVSTINDYGIKDEIKRDINCNLGSLNIVNVMENKHIDFAVRTGVRALTAVSDMSNIANAPGVKKANSELHAIGLGAMNLHGYLAKNKIAYESEYAKDFVRTFFMMMNYYSIQESMEIAKETGVKFKGFESSEYANGKYFEKYIKNSYKPVTEKVYDLFEGIYIPNELDWLKLQHEVAIYGLYNAYRLAIAPTQSIGYVQNATPSIAPIVSQVEIRTYGNSTTYYPMPFLDKSNYFFYKSAYDMDMMKMIDLVSEIQEHVDQGISTILYVDSETSTSELVKLYMYAHHKGLKSLYYTRTRNLSVDECLSCSV